MHYIYFALFIVISACSSSAPRKPAMSVSQIEIPKDSLSLDEALAQDPKQTLTYLKERIKVPSYAGIGSKDPAVELPLSLRIDSERSDGARAKSELLSHLRKFRNLNWNKKFQRAQELVTAFKCEKVFESQAMGFSLERNFPEPQAMSLSESLHEKVISCDTAPKQESVLRLAIFSIQKGRCDKALEYLKKFPPTLERGVHDRLSYVQGLCAPVNVAADRNPWGGYGIRLGDLKIENPDRPLWFLTTASGNEEWDRLLASFVELVENGEHHKLRYVAGLLNYESFRTLPHSFQASVMVLMNYSGADLSVFQTLHRFLQDRPFLMTKSVAGLLFPVRYWKEILANSPTADPILVKALIRQESAFNPHAKSPAKAYGLMQLIYPTARKFGVKSRQHLFDPAVNIRAGSKFLGNLIEKFGSVELALAAYNAGPLVVRDWQKRYPTDNMDLFVEMIPYTETREYVRLVNRNYKIYQNLLLEKSASNPDLAKK